jgi:hypothetical protein
MLPCKEDAIRGSLIGARTIRNRALAKYYLSPSVCKYCLKTIMVRDGEAPTLARKRQFCDNSCAAIFNNTGRIKVPPRYCLFCQTKCRDKYCGHKCMFNHQYATYISEWQRGERDGRKGTCGMSDYIRRYLFEKYCHKCSKCSWAEVHPISGKIPLQVDHIDGNCLNNTESNLQLLCPNCHSLTPTFGALNAAGKGRRTLLKSRYIYLVN